MTRAEKVIEAQRLRAEGLLLREIAERMGSRLKTVSSWLNDPDLSRHRAKLAGYSQPCAECGGPVSAQSRENVSKTCRACLTVTAEDCIAALQAFVAEHGRNPREAEFQSGSPTYRCFVRHFGSWNGALTAAGLPWNMDRSAETWEAIQRAVRDGERVEDIAQRHGVTPGAIYQRFKYRGLRMRDYRSAAA